MVASLHADNDSLELNEDPGFGEEHQVGLLHSLQLPALNEPYSSAGSTVTAVDLPQGDQLTSKGSFTLEPITWKGPSRFAFLWDGLSLALSVALIALGGRVVALRGRIETDASKRFIELTGLITTLWPILFATILGNAIKAYANYKVERGVPLISLEQLMGSLTIGGTIVTALTLAKVLVRPSTLLLITLWSFSPLGSQAIFRAVFLKHIGSTGTMDIQLYTPDRLTQIAVSEFQGTDRTSPEILALFQSVLHTINSGTQYCNGSCDGFEQLAERLGGAAAAGLATAVDSWGNPRIPSLRGTPGYDASNPDDWVMTPYTEHVQNYSSLLGVRIQGINSGFQGKASFTIPASYDELNCIPWTDIDLSNQTSVNNWMSDKYGTFGYTYNASLDQPPYRDPERATVALWQSDFIRFFIDFAVVRKNGSRLGVSPDRLIFGSLDNEKRHDEVMGLSPTILHYTECSISPVYLDANITCHSTESGMQCGVEAVRRMPPVPGYSNVTMFNFDNSTTIGVNMAQEFPKSAGDPGHSGRSTAIEMYLQDPSDAFAAGIGRLDFYANVSAAPMELFQERLGLLVNTLFHSNLHPESYFGRPLQHVYASTEILNLSASTTTPLPPVYELRLAWMTIYFVAAIIMFLATVVATILRWRCSAPQLLGYVSSLVTGSPHFTKAGVRGKSTESGPEIAARLSGVRVMIADVKANDKTGRIAFAPASEGRRVKVGRLYD